MKLKEILLRIRSMFSKSDVTSEIEANIDLLNKLVLPNTLLCAAKFKDGVWASVEAAEFDKFINKNIKVVGRYPTFFDVFVKILEDTKVKLIITRDILSNSETEEITREAISARDFNVLRITEVSRFVIDYIRKANYLMITAEDAAIATASKGQVKTGYGDANDQVVEHLTKTIGVFLETSKLMLMPEKDFAANWNKIAEVQLSPTTIDAIATVNGEAQIDPFSTKNFSVNWLPTLIFGEAAASYTLKRYDEAVAEKMAVEHLIRRIERKKANEPDNASLDTQIEYHRGRIDKLSAEIERIEDRYGIKRG